MENNHYACCVKTRLPPLAIPVVGEGVVPVAEVEEAVVEVLEAAEAVVAAEAVAAEAVVVEAVVEAGTMTTTIWIPHLRV